MQRIKKTGANAAWYGILIIVGFVMIFPYIWLLSSSLKMEKDIFVIPPQIFPSPATLMNYVDAVKRSQILRWIYNSAYITVIVVIGGSFVSSMAGFAFAKLRFRGKNMLFLLPLCAIMIPNEVILVPMFKLWTYLGLTNTHIPLIIPHIFGIQGMFGVFLFRQFYLSIPQELCEAARIDGCSPWGIYTRIILPLSQSTLLCLAIFNFSSTWNDYLNPLIYLNSSEKYTVALGLSLFSDMQGTLWGQLMAGCVMATLPLVILFFLAQDKFIESVAMTGMKE